MPAPMVNDGLELQESYPLGTKFYIYPSTHPDSGEWYLLARTSIEGAMLIGLRNFNRFSDACMPIEGWVRSSNVNFQYVLDSMTTPDGAATRYVLSAIEVPEVPQ